jgi:methylated-DNA-[protein]-cysteine S-methyltransferase
VLPVIIQRVGTRSPDTAALLRSRGLRSTPQRRAILEAFKGGPYEHLSAEEVHSRASQAMPDLGRGTVYAALAEFTELGLLGAVGAPEPVRYEVNVDRHDHFRCRLCLRLFDIDLALTEPDGRDGFRIERIELRAEGICKECGDYGGGLDRGSDSIRDDDSPMPGLDARGVAARKLDTALGTIHLVATDAGLIRVAFAEDAEVPQIDEVARSRRGSVAARGQVDRAVMGLERYLSGDASAVDCEIDWSVVRPEQHSALEAAAEIPYGATRSYSDLGIDVDPRILGESLGSNPLPIVSPCHRVIRGLEVPTSFVGGSERRRWLLDHEQPGV